MNHNSLGCQHYILLPRNQCYCCNSREIIVPYRCRYCYSCSISFEEILTWSVILSLIFSLHNAIKLWIMIFLTVYVMYWICTKTEIACILKEFYRRRLYSSIDGKSSTDDKKITKNEHPRSINTQQSGDNSIRDNDVSLNTSMNVDRDVNFISR